MLKDLPKFISSVKDFGFTPGKTIFKLIQYVEEALSTFQYVGDSGDYDDWEDDISQELVRVLNTSTPNTPFYFDKQHKNKRRRGSAFPDIGVCVGNGPYFFHFEAKLFVREYVYGRTGGIERFKREIHGIEYINSVSHQFAYSGILGYMLNNDFEYWQKKVNSWIQSRIHAKTDIEWTNQDKLNFDNAKSRVAKLYSKNKTITSEIQLVHLWVDLSK